MTNDIEVLLNHLRAGTDPETPGLTEKIAALAPAERAAVIARLLPEAPARRWLRGEVLTRLEPDGAHDLALHLLGFEEDFARDRRDRTTPAVVRALPVSQLVEAAPFLAGSNAAGALWERLGEAGSELVVDAARRAMAEGDAAARETTLLLLLYEPFPPTTLSPGERRELIELALADPDDEIRGLAAELAAEEAPERLLSAPDHWTRDPGERVRAATWDVLFAADAEQAIDAAIALLVDEDAPLGARRSALLALGEALPTPQVEPLLATMVGHPLVELAEDAAALLWSRHRTPVIAEAAAQSPHATVRDIAERLLDPRRGSPMAGGFRPGAGQQGYGFYEELRRVEPEE